MEAGEEPLSYISARNSTFNAVSVKKGGTAKIAPFVLLTMGVFYFFGTLY
jgi:hypothetical protein